MSGGKGGSTTSSVEIPEYIERAAQENLNRAQAIAQMGYVPYYGPDVAAFTPMQEAAMQNVASAAGAFGLATPTGASVTGMPVAQTFEGGIRGYSSAPLFEQAQAELAARRPAQKSYIDSFFIDPVTGTYGANAPALVDYTQFGTMADERAAQRANELAMARDPYHGGDSVADFLDPNNRMGLQETMDRVNYAAADDAAGGVSVDAAGNVATRMYYGENEKGDIISVGYGANQVDPALAAAAGYTPREDNPFNYSFSDHMSKMGSDIKDIATQVASDVSKISPVANIIGLLSKDEDEPKSSTPTVVPKPKPKPKRDDSNDTPTVVPKPKPKPKRDDSNDSPISIPKPKPKPKKKRGGGGR